jgi:4-amino-4-deoxy-L-arabinose transferase-like glycosyltransferase
MLLASTDQRRWRWGVLAIVALATAARVAMLVASLHFTLFGDPEDYQRHAVSIAAGDGFPTTVIASPGTASAFRPPGYPFALGVVYAVVGVHPQAGRALSAALGVLTVVLIAYLGRELWDARVGLVAGVIAAVFPPLVGLNASLLSEALFLPLEMGFALALVGLSRRPDGLWWALAAGALCGLAALTRAVADAWLPVALGVILARAGTHAGTGAGAGSGRHRWRGAAVVIAAFAVVIAPWTIRNIEALHSVVPITTEGGFTFAGQYNVAAGEANDFRALWRDPLQLPSIAAGVDPLFRRPGGVNEAQLDAALRRSGLHYLARHPGHLVLATGLDTLRLFDLGVAHGFATALAYREMAIPSALSGLTTGSAQLLALLALVVVVVRVLGLLRVRLGPWWLWAIPLLTLALTVPMVGNPLKRAPLDPMLILVVSAGLVAAVGAVRRRAGAGRPPRAMVAEPG